MKMKQQKSPDERMDKRVTKLATNTFIVCAQYLIATIGIPKTKALFKEALKERK